MTTGRASWLARPEDLPWSDRVTEAVGLAAADAAAGWGEGEQRRLRAAITLAALADAASRVGSAQTGARTRTLW